MSKFQKLVRFEDSLGKIHYGELPSSVDWKAELVGQEVRTYEGGDPWSEGFHLTENSAKIVQVKTFLDSFYNGQDNQLIIFKGSVPDC